MTKTLESQDVIYYPASDGEEMGSTGPHMRWGNLIYWGLTFHLQSRPHFIAGNIKITTAPDLFVVFDPHPRRVWGQADEGGKAPSANSNQRTRCPVNDSYFSITFYFIARRMSEN